MSIGLSEIECSKLLPPHGASVRDYDCEPIGYDSVLILASGEPAFFSDKADFLISVWFSFPN